MASTFNQAEYPFTEEYFYAQSNNNNHILTEEFPTFGNWAANMSQYLIPKQKFKLQTVGNTIGTIPMEDPTRVS